MLRRRNYIFSSVEKYGVGSVEKAKSLRRFAVFSYLGNLHCRKKGPLFAILLGFFA